MSGAIGVGLALAALSAGSACAHVGSPDTWYEGNAGSYPIRVVVRAPGVVPGLAQIDVRVLSGKAERVTVQPFAWNAGASGAPPPDIAHAVSGEPGLFTVNLWFMVASSYGVHVSVNGPEGAGTAIVPVQAVATQRLPMEASMQWTLIALGLFLCFGLVTVFWAAVREGSLTPGERPDPKRAPRAWMITALSAAVLAVGLWAGRSWWDGVDRAYAAGMYKPFQMTASVVDSSGGRWARLSIDDPRWRARGWTPLITDHGKLMHLFLIREGDLGAFAHLHPVPRDSQQFVARVPLLPAGRYRVYADIVHESGFAQTLTATLDLAVSTAPVDASDRDDSWFAETATGDSAAAEIRSPLADGATLVWERGSEPWSARRDRPLRFRVETADGSPAVLEPYLGMAAHAVITREDGTVFAHLHPIGTVSMASSMALTMRTPADSIPGSLGARLARAESMGGHAMPTPHPASGVFSIPYGFPREGRYRMWVQVKREGRIGTAAFDLEVGPAPSRT